MVHSSSAEDALISRMIEIYRELIRSRYQYEVLCQSGKLSASISRQMVDDIRNFFLNEVYPDVQKRRSIEQAFEILGSYVHQPAKAMTLLGSMASALFIFGRHLPAAINAGLTTLKSFLDARHLEQTIIKAAREHGINEQATVEDLKQCIVRIPKREIVQFIGDVRDMFILMSNTELLEKTIRIMEMVISKMHSKPHLYPPHEIEGINLGKNILISGLNLFKGLSDTQKTEIARTIYDVEMSFIEELYSTYKN